MATRNFVPRNDGEGSIGTNIKQWGDIQAKAAHIANRDISADGSKLDTHETAINTLQTKVTTLEHAYAGAKAAATVADMTDQEQIYVYVGSETGYTNGNWYYWNGTAWTSGGVYNATALETDKTLTVSGAAADSAIVGFKNTEMKSKLLKIVSTNIIHEIGDVIIYAKQGQRYLNKYFDFYDLATNGIYVLDIDDVINNLQGICGEVRFLDESDTEISHVYIYANSMKTVFKVPENTEKVRIYAHAALAEYFPNDTIVKFKNIRIYKGQEKIQISNNIYNKVNSIKMLDLYEDFMEGTINNKGKFDDNQEHYSNVRYATKKYIKAEKINISNHAASCYVYVNVYSEMAEESFVEQVNGYAKDTETKIYTVPNGCFVRLLITTTSETVTLEDYINGIDISIINGEILSGIFDDEIKETINTVMDKVNGESVIIPIITDTHDNPHNYNAHKVIGTTLDNLRVLSKNIPFDAVVHLGDFIAQAYYAQTNSNNAVYKSITKNINDLEKINNILLLTPGNHDGELANTDYNKDFLYKCNGKIGFKYSNFANGAYHFYDIPNRNIRLVFLAIPDDNYYGPSVEQLNWLCNVALNTREDCRVIIFSHIGNMCDMYSKDVLEGIITAYHNHTTYSGTAYGGTNISADFTRYNSTKVVCAISGHVHGDSVFIPGARSENGAVNGFPCPAVTIGAGGNITTSALIPEAEAPSRTINTVTEVLFDILVYNMSNNSLKLVRFGAGNDRTIN